MSNCTLDRRREDVRKAPLYGIEYVEVSASQTVLEVFFLGRAPDRVTAANVSITGGSPVAVTSIRLTRQSDLTLDDWMEVRVNQPGDFSAYTLAMVALDANGAPTGAAMDGFDPRYAQACFIFKASCPTDQDCLAPPVCPPTPANPPAINYLAKDYGSFRQLMLDRLAQTMPSWQETHEPDIGVMLVELLAYAGDQLSYFQDAVATEAYLGTARRRISVRRHARLVDYTMHEGCNARAWVTVAVGSDTTLDPTNLFFCTDFPGAPQSAVLQWTDFLKAQASTVEVFQPLGIAAGTKLVFYAAHNTIDFYSWGDCACCLPIGTTSATLRDSWVKRDGAKGRALNLKAGDALIFEEVIGPDTGNPADADPTHRQVVRLLTVTPSVDPLYDRDDGGIPVLEITWCTEDALTFPLCLSAVMPAPDCTCREGISVARGNVVLVDNGMTVAEPLGTVPTDTTSATCPTDCEPSQVVLTPGRFAPVLQQSPVTFAQALPICGCASTILAQDPREALPQVWLTGTVQTAEGAVSTPWTAQPDLLESGPDDTHFVVEVDDWGNAHLRFGNGDEGMVPPAGADFAATYRVGNGTAGNVGAGAIRKIVFRSVTDPGVSLTPRNPLPAAGGLAWETMAEVRQFAPYAFRDVLERAVTAADYATIARDNARRREDLLESAAPRQGGKLPDICTAPFQSLQNARGTLRWNGSWYEAMVMVDPLGTETTSAATLSEIKTYLEPFRRIGHDLRVAGAQYVSLDLGLSICVKPGFVQADVGTAIKTLLGTGWQANGTPALFNPNALTFGQGVYLSPIIAACQSVPGVMEVQVTRLVPYVPGTVPPGAKPDDVPAGWMLPIGPFQIARLDNNPNAPGNGRLTLVLRGGR
jgi:hypothetical protein